MSFRQNLLKTVDRIKTITGPTGLDVRPHGLTIRKRTWTDAPGTPGATYTDDDLVLPQKYKIRQISMREISGSGGAYQSGDIVVEHITPSDAAGVGYTPQQLKPSITSDNEERLYLVTGIGGLVGEYSIVELRSWKPFAYDLVLTRRETTP